MIQIIAIDGCLFVGFTLFIYSWGALKQGPSLREKCLYAEFFWSLFSRIRTDTLISNHLLGEKYPDSEFSVPYFPAFGLYTEI